MGNKYTVSFDEMNERLDSFLSLKSNIKRSGIQRLIKSGLAMVNGGVEKPGYKVRAGDVIELIVPDEPDTILIAEDIPLDILWEDDHMVVVNKPPGMVVYPAVGNRSGTLMNALAFRCRKLSPVGAPLRPGIVHRLDKDTSGIIVIAKDNVTHYNLVDQFREREIEKQYLALVFGDLKDDNGEIKKAIGRSWSNRKKMSTKARRAKEAITQYEVVQRFGYATLARVRILTGRTHQIRVHFAFIGHPVLGDSLYGKKLKLETEKGFIKFSRQMLHACSLKLKHPATGDYREFKAPMPGDMQEAIDKLKEFST
ncbi:MAG: RluA family pseudouridine synthase [Nitrospiraceae bacterium]|nr:MAG: RluA family pseudouridine synthase [Nitrospiraceae bacterium]